MLTRASSHETGPTASPKRVTQRALTRLISDLEDAVAPSARPSARNAAWTSSTVTGPPCRASPSTRSRRPSPRPTWGPFRPAGPCPGAAAQVMQSPQEVHEIAAGCRGTRCTSPSRDRACVAARIRIVDRPATPVACHRPRDSDSLLPPRVTDASLRVRPAARVVVVARAPACRLRQCPSYPYSTTSRPGLPLAAPSGVLAPGRIAIPAPIFPGPLCLLSRPDPRYVAHALSGARRRGRGRRLPDGFHRPACPTVARRPWRWHRAPAGCWELAAIPAADTAHGAPADPGPYPRPPPQSRTASNVAGMYGYRGGSTARVGPHWNMVAV